MLWFVHEQFVFPLKVRVDLSLFEMAFYLFSTNVSNEAITKADGSPTSLNHERSSAMSAKPTPTGAAI